MTTFNLKQVLDFLYDLQINNNRPWFEEHKEAYNEAKITFEGFVNALIQRLSAYEDLSGVTARGSIMRIYRDIRFSKDKTPYKSCMTAHIASRGKKSGSLGFGIRLAPLDSGAAGGLWDPSPEQLAKFRNGVDRNKDKLLDLVKTPDFMKYFGSIQGEKLKTAPKGYAKDHPAAEILKLKQVYVFRTFTDEAVLADDFVDQLVTTYVAMKPFLDYLNNAII